MINKIKNYFFIQNEDRFWITYLKLILLWCPLCSVLFLLGFSSTQNFIHNFLISTIISISCATACMGGSLLLSKLEALVLHHFKMPQPKHGPVWGVLVSYIFLVPGLFIGFQLAGLYSHLANQKLRPPNFEDYRQGLIFGFFISGAFLLFEVLRESKLMQQESKMKLKELENLRLQAEVSALNAQMNPHLLFNSLNTIAGTILNQPEVAEEITIKLSELYRGVLKAAKQKEHSLKEELEIVRAYLEIEQHRFGERVDFQISIAEQINQIEMQIPPLLIQPIIENSIKHGLSPKKEGGKIWIDISINDKKYIIQIKDNGIGNKAQNSIGTGTAIDNCKARLELMYSDEATYILKLSEFGADTKIELPIQEKT